MPQPVQPRRALRAPPARPGAASHRQTTRQRRTPVQPALGPGFPLRIEVTAHRGDIRPGDPAGVRREAFLAERLPVVPVGHDHVLAADVPGRKQKGEADAGRDLEQRLTLACRRALEARVESGELLGRRQLRRARA